MPNIFERFREIKELSRRESDQSLTIEGAERACRQFRKSGGILSVLLSGMAVLVWFKWRLAGSVVLVLAVSYIAGLLIYYRKFKRDVYSRVKSR